MIEVTISLPKAPHMRLRNVERGRFFSCSNLYPATHSGLRIAGLRLNDDIVVWMSEGRRPGFDHISASGDTLLDDFRYHDDVEIKLS